MSFHFTSSKLRGLVDHLAGVTNKFLKNLDKMNTQNANKSINVKPLLQCFSIDTISKLVFAIDCDSYTDK